MFFVNIEEVIPESNIVCVSPHYDDFLFFLGNYVLEMKSKGFLDSKRFTNISTFSRSNYQQRDVEGNNDRGLSRVKYATGIRLIEDLECLDDLLGLHNYTYQVMGEEESKVRGKELIQGGGEMEMALGSYETLEQNDWDILMRMEACISQIAASKDTAIIMPLSIKGHIDHFIVREAGARTMKRTGNKAAFYFAEDKPYAGIMTDRDNAINDEFIARYSLIDRAFQGHPEKLLQLAYQHYPSQVDGVYDIGVNNRVEQLGQAYKTAVACDRIYKYEN